MVDHIDNLREEYQILPMSELEAEIRLRMRRMLSASLIAAHRNHPGGVLEVAARILGVHRSRMSRLMKKYGVRKDGSLCP